MKLTTDLHLLPRLRMHGVITTLPYVLMTWCLIKHEDFCTFTIFHIGITVIIITINRIIWQHQKCCSILNSTTSYRKLVQECSMKITIFWNVMPCRLVDVHWCFGANKASACLLPYAGYLLGLLFNPEDGNST
jgi:hypothetical protein